MGFFVTAGKEVNNSLLTTTDNYNVWHDFIIILLTLILPADRAGLVAISWPEWWELEEALHDRVYSPQAPALGGLNGVDYRMRVGHLGVEGHREL